MSKKQAQSPKVVIIGVGNLLLKDEGIGIHVAHALQKLDLGPEVSIIDGGTSPDLIAYCEGGHKLVIIDAAKVGGEPGAVYRFHPADLDSTARGFSVHDIGIEQSLKLMSLIGTQPEETVIIGVEPAEIDWGTELSPGLKDKVPEIVRVVLKELGAPRPRIV